MKLCFVALLLWYTPMLLLGQSRGGPHWVYKTPKEDGYYFGVGAADIDESTNYRLTARKRALREIAEKLMVEVQSTSNLKVGYVENQTNYQLNEEIILNSDILLNDVESIDDWFDKKDDKYFVLLRLNFWEYEQDRNEKFMRTMDLAAQYIEKSKKWFEQREYEQGFAFIGQGINLLKEESSNFFEPDLKNRLNVRISEYTKELTDKLFSMSLKINTPRIYWDFLGREHDVIEIEFKDAYTEQPIKGFDFNVVSVRGDIFDYQILELEDRYELIINGALPENGEAVFFVTPNIAAFTAGVDIPASTVAAIKSNNIIVEMDYIPIKITSREEIYGKKNEAGPFTAFIANFLSMCSLRQAQDDEVPYYEVEITFEIARKDKRDVNHIASANGQITVYRSDGSETLEASFNLPPSRGYGKDWQAAANNSFKSLTNRIDPVLQELVTTLWTVD